MNIKRDLDIFTKQLETLKRNNKIRKEDYFNLEMMQQSFVDMIIENEPVKIDFGTIDPPTGYIGDFYCPKCGIHISPTKKEDIKFCWNCGVKLNWDVTIEDADL